jgi:hypothetical protein
MDIEVRNPQGELLGWMTGVDPERVGPRRRFGELAFLISTRTEPKPAFAKPTAAERAWRPVAMSTVRLAIDDWLPADGRPGYAVFVWGGNPDLLPLTRCFLPA